MGLLHDQEISNQYTCTSDQGVSAMPEDNDYKKFDTIALLVGIVIVLYAIIMAFVF